MTEQPESNFFEPLCDNSQSEISLEIFSDEIFNVRDPLDNSNWMYIGALFIPTQNKNNCFKKLNDYRCVKHKNWSEIIHDCIHICGHHAENDTEIHYKEVHKLDARYRIAQNWIQFVSNEACQRHSKLLYINILGLNLSKMNLDLFGNDSDRDLTLYNRFYRTALFGGLNYFFKNFRKISIDTIYHDKGSQEYHALFPWHSIYKINLENTKISVNNDTIVFLDSDHRRSGKKESHFIQLIDLILGATFVGLHNPSEKYQKQMIGYTFKPTLEILLDRVKNPDTGIPWGRYYPSNYHRGYQVSFFPNNSQNFASSDMHLDFNGRLTGYGFGQDNFYWNRPILLKAPGQTGWDRWM
ncbi:MAG: hypothetical protein ABFC71_07230 [Methanoregula sp.]